MKKVTLFLAIGMVALVVFGCGNGVSDIALNNNNEQSDSMQFKENTPDTLPASIIWETEDAVVSWANWSDDPKIKSEACNKDMFGTASEKHLPIYKCDTLEELNDFRSTFSEIFDMSGAWDEIPSFHEVTADFADDFFTENALLLIYVEANSASLRFDMDTVVNESDALCVYVKQTHAPEVQDTMMAGWLIMLPVSKDQIRDCTKFDAVLK